MTEDEVKILKYFVDRLQAEGANKNQFGVSIDEITNKFSSDIDGNKLDKLLKNLLTFEYLRYPTLSTSFFVITQKGLGVIQSIKSKEEQLKNKSSIKKLSDWFVEHKGLLTFLSLVVAFIAIFL